ncbi:MAG: hypothetical protein V3T31_13385 [candidate division Zixibacteria bacterium]
MSPWRYRECKTVNYLVGSYLDLTDVVKSIEKMIDTNIDARQRPAAKKACQVSFIALKTSGFILRMKIPEQAFG